MSTHQEISSFIWKVCDDELRGLFKPHEYGDVIIPIFGLKSIYYLPYTLKQFYDWN